jgi:endonuclease YncB( thermonuclease family)
MFLNKRKVILLISISSLILITTLIQVNSQELRVVDGDTIHLNGEKIRFTGIDTPELKQTCIKEEAIDPCGITAKEILIKKISNNKVLCISEGKDRYNRTLAECFVNDESLSSYLVRSGYAFAYRKYSKKFVPDEDYAKLNKIGMWSMKFSYPWEYRKSNKN